MAGCAALIAGIFWLDANRGGPANAMARCSLLLSRADRPAADVLVIGSSRIGVTLDPVVMQRILSTELRSPIRVDRLALGNNTLRAMSGLLENYFEAQGPPRTLVLEVMFMSQRTIDRLASRNLAPERHLYRRDVNLLDFGQLLAQPYVAMPFTMGESDLDLWSHRLRGAVLRSGALAYQAIRDPTRSWKRSACRHEDWMRETDWPLDFRFSHAEFNPENEMVDLIESIEEEVAQRAQARELKDWQLKVPRGAVHAYQFGAGHRRGEVGLLRRMIALALKHDAEILLVPLPLYGHALDHAELREFVSRYPRGVHVFDLYGQIRVDFDPLWYDDAHVELSSVGRLTTALMAQRLLQSQALSPRQ